MSYDLKKIRMHQHNVVVGSNTKQKQQIVTRANKAGDLFGKYFVLHTATKNIVVYLDDVSVVDEEDFLTPVIPSQGWETLRVPISENESATGIATAIKTALVTIAEVTVETEGRVVTYTMVAAGYAHPGRDAIKKSLKTGFTFSLIDLGFSETSIGAIKDDVIISGMEMATKAIQIHQEGETDLAEVVSGYTNPTLTFSQYETDKKGIERVLMMIGGRAVLPEVEDASVLSGWGNHLIGAQKPQLRMKLVPIKPEMDAVSETWHFWKCSFALENFTMSRTEFTDLPLTATIYPDKEQIAELAFYARGDVSYLEE